MNCLLVFSLAVLGACSASPCGINAVSEVCGSALPGRNIFAQTPVIENPTRAIPAIIPPTSVSQSCHCLKTIVRPQIRNEVITVPQIDRIVRVVPSPVVEAISVNLGGNTRNAQLPISGYTSEISGVSGLNGLSGLSGVSGLNGFSGLSGVSGLNGFSGLSGISGGIVDGVSGVLSGSCLGNSYQGYGVVNSGVVGNVGCGSVVV